MMEEKSEKERLRDARASVEAWGFAAKYLALPVEAARMVGSDELVVCLEGAEARALDEKGNALDVLEAADTTL
jgi:hypothetical protein